ncbi:unnamed protein product, partial [Heterotrigona itama]
MQQLQNMQISWWPSSPVLKLCNIRAALRAQTRAPSRFLMQHRRCASSSFQIAVLIYRFKFATTPARARSATAWPTTKPATTRVRTYRVDDVHAGGLYRLENNSIKDKFILFAIVAVVAAFPEPERERRGLLAAPALALARPALAPAIALAAPAPAPIAIAAPA